jgi:hypothetical protein
LIKTGIEQAKNFGVEIVEQDVIDISMDNNNEPIPWKKSCLKTARKRKSTDFL